MIKIKYYIILILLQAPISVFATGSSIIKSQIKPIIMNKDGDVLCKTMFLDNWM